MTIRTLQAGDADALLAFETANRAWFEQHVEAREREFYTRPGVALHIAAYLDEYRHGRLHPCVLLDEAGAIVGRANLRHIDRAAGVAEVGYRIGHDQVGRGLASSALRHLMRLAQTEYGLARLHAWVSPENAASARVIEKNGFRRVPGMPSQDVIVGQRLRQSFLYQCDLSAPA
jgi:ribosomal-protein-alanine N-acetyltransferase